MSDVGARVRARRKALQMTQDELAAEAKVNRDTLGAIENGLGFRASSLTKIEKALDRIEEETGMHVQPVGDPSEHLVEFTVEGNFGVKAVVKGPISDLEQLQAAVSKLVRDMQKPASGEGGEVVP